MGLGVTPESHHGNYTVLQVGGLGSIMATTAAGAAGGTWVSNNAYYDVTDSRWEYFATESDEAAQIEIMNGIITLKTAGAGVADAAINATGTWVTALIIENDGDALFAQKVGIGVTPLTGSLLTVEGTIKIKEVAAAGADTAAYGQVWVGNATPNELWFTDDAGTDTQLSSHPLDAPPALYNYGPGIDWIGKRVQKYLGIIFWQTIDGTVTEETFDAYNDRRKKIEGHTDLVKRDWRTVQEAAQQTEIERLINEKLSEEVETTEAEALETVEKKEKIKVKGEPKQIYQFDAASGTVKQVTVEKDEEQEIGTGEFVTRFKTGYRLDAEIGKIWRKKTRAEAEQEIKIPALEQPPAWLQARGVSL